MSTRRHPTGTLRRSFALPRHLIEEAVKAAPPELHDNLNRLVTVALQEYVTRRRDEEFARQMAEMARDPQMRAEIKTIAHDFRHAESDGL